MATLLEEAVAHIRAGNIETAKPLLIDFLKQNPNHEDAWLWMSRCVTEPEQKKYCFERVLKINPQNQHAIRGLDLRSSPVSPKTQPRENVVQQRQSPKRILGLSYVEIGIMVVLLCIGCVFAGAIARNFLTRNFPTSSSTPRPTSPPLPTDEPIYFLELLAMNDTREYGYVTIEGQVRNISGIRLEAVLAVVQFYDANDNFVKSESALIDFDPIMPGQASPFSVITTYNPAMKRYTTTFTLFTGEPLPTKDGRK